MRRRGDEAMRGTVVEANGSSHIVANIHGDIVTAVAPANLARSAQPGDPVLLVRAGRRMLAFPGYTPPVTIDAYLRWAFVPTEPGVTVGWDFDNLIGTYARLIDGSPTTDPPGDWNIVGGTQYSLLAAEAVARIRRVAVQRFDQTPWFTGGQAAYPPESYGSDWDNFPDMGTYIVQPGGDWESFGVPSGSIDSKTQQEFPRTLVWGVWVPNTTWSAFDVAIMFQPPWSENPIVNTLDTPGYVDSVIAWSAHIPANATMASVVGGFPGFRFDVVSDYGWPEWASPSPLPFAAIIVNDEG